MAFFGFGELAREIANNCMGIEITRIFEIDRRKIGKKYKETEIEPGIIIDPVPKKFEKDIISTDVKTFEERIIDTDIDIAIIAVNFFAKKSAEEYVKILLNKGIDVINLTPIKLKDRINEFIIKEKKHGVFLGDLIKPIDDPLTKIIKAFKDEEMREIYVLHRVSFDTISLANKKLKIELEENISKKFSINYFIDLRKLPNGYAIIEAFIESHISEEDSIEYSVAIRYPIKKLCAKAVCQLMVMLYKYRDDQNMIYRLANDFFYL